jgi:hypothetical protein
MEIQELQTAVVAVVAVATYHQAAQVVLELSFSNTQILILQPLAVELLKQLQHLAAVSRYQQLQQQAYQIQLVGHNGTLRIFR